MSVTDQNGSPARPPKSSWSIRDFQYASGLSKNGIYKLIGAGLLESVKIGERRFVLSENPAADLRRIAEAEKAHAA